MARRISACLRACANSPSTMAQSHATRSVLDTSSGSMSEARSRAWATSLPPSAARPCISQKKPRAESSSSCAVASSWLPRCSRAARRLSASASKRFARGLLARPLDTLLGFLWANWKHQLAWRCLSSSASPRVPSSASTANSLIVSSIQKRGEGLEEHARGGAGSGRGATRGCRGQPRRSPPRLPAYSHPERRTGARRASSPQGSGSSEDNSMVALSVC